MHTLLGNFCCDNGRYACTCGTTVRRLCRHDNDDCEDRASENWINCVRPLSQAFFPSAQPKNTMYESSY